MELNIHNESHLLSEASRKDLTTKSRIQSKKRYKKRLNYQVSNFRGVDLKQMFENDYFVFKTPIKDYVCVIAFPGVFSELRNVVKSTNGSVKKINLQMVIKALRKAFDATDDVKVNCTCADWRYRFAYWATQNGYKYGEPETRPSDITNPDDAIGATCKHLNLLLSNKRWLTKAASTVNSFIKAYPEKAALYLYDEDEIVEEPEESSEEEVTSSEEDNTSEPDIDSNSGESGEDENTTDREITDSLKIVTESDLISDDGEFLDTSDSGRSWIPDQRKKISEISNRLIRYAKKLDLEDQINFLGYRKYSRRENYSVFKAVSIDGKEFKLWITYSNGQFKLLSSSGMVMKSNKDPQKIVKYIVDNLIY